MWLADDSLLGPLWGRIRHLMPQELGGGALAGLNARLRLYRYDAHHVYRPVGGPPCKGSRLGEVQRVRQAPQLPPAATLDAQ